MRNRIGGRAFMFAAALLAGAWGPTIGQEVSGISSNHSSRWRTKLKNTTTTVAAMKRAARKSRNRSKRNG